MVSRSPLRTIVPVVVVVMLLLISSGPGRCQRDVQDSDEDKYDCHPEEADTCFMDVNDNLMCNLGKPSRRNCANRDAHDLCDGMSDALMCCQEIMENCTENKGLNTFRVWLTGLRGVHHHLCVDDAHLALITDLLQGSKCFRLKKFINCVEERAQLTHVADLLTTNLDLHECNKLQVSVAGCIDYTEKNKGTCRGTAQAVTEALIAFFTSTACGQAPQPPPPCAAPSNVSGSRDNNNNSGNTSNTNNEANNTTSNSSNSNTNDKDNINPTDNSSSSSSSNNAASSDNADTKNSRNSSSSSSNNAASSDNADTDTKNSRNSSSSNCNNAASSDNADTDTKNSRNSSSNSNVQDQNSSIKNTTATATTTTTTTTNNNNSEKTPQSTSTTPVACQQTQKDLSTSGTPTASTVVVTVLVTVVVVGLAAVLLVKRGVLLVRTDLDRRLIGFSEGDANSAYDRF